ncbi:MAG TPA: alkaline phosphatase, partial [Petrotogaceae bacterium]|nr:alkaline phosphatase [Petrotogaceae bacterium]
MKKRIITVLLAFILQLTALSAVKNIILFIGDGMGTAAVDLSRMVLLGKEKLWDFENTIYIGLQKTYSENLLTTDSAAAATALSSGYKTANGLLGTLSNGTTTKSILKAFRETGRSAGLITTVTVTHATPAGFCVSMPDRDELAIADEYAKTKPFDLIMGGGRQYFMPKNSTVSKRTDNINLIKDFQNCGYTYISNTAQLSELTGKTPKILGLFSDSSMPNALDKRFLNSSVPTLAQMTRAALTVLGSNPKGFFLMVESGKIDFRAHANDTAGTVWEVNELNEAFKEALSFLNKDTDTLIIVTADHETGGLTLLYPRLQLIKSQKATNELIVSLIKNKDISQSLKTVNELTGIKDINEEDIIKIKESSTPEIELSKILNERYEVRWSTVGHTCSNVNVYAFGKKAELFTGVYENTELAIKMFSA